LPGAEVYAIQRDATSPEVPALAQGRPESEVDAVESALADALSAAAAASRFDVVAQLAKELEARRLARAGNVVSFDDARRRGGRDGS
jgi:hypothetical protein